MTQVQAQGIADRLRNDKIPADVLWLDIDYQDRNRPFTVNAKTFPDLPRLTSDLKAEGFRLVAITDHGVICTGGSKLAGHGGFSNDDRNVQLLVSSPRIKHARVVDETTFTTQIAPTILHALDLNPRSLQAVRDEGVEALKLK